MTNKIYEIISAQMKEIVWDKNSILEIDINCDGKKDYAILGQSAQGISVAVVLGPISIKRKIEAFTFSVGRQSQDSLCQLPAKLETESLDYDPTEMVGKLSGFRSSKKCASFKLSDDACDSFHFYWDHMANALSWWRL